MVLVAAIGNTSQVCDPSLVSYALEQEEMLRSHDYQHKCIELFGKIYALVPSYKFRKELSDLSDQLSKTTFFLNCSLSTNA